MGGADIADLGRREFPDGLDMTVRQRRPRMKDPKYLKSFKGRDCECCSAPPDTVVPAHIRSLSAGSGVGLKPSDTDVIGLCQKCHILLDHGGTLDRMWVVRNVLISLCRDRYDEYLGRDK